MPRFLPLLLAAAVSAACSAPGRQSSVGQAAHWQAAALPQAQEREMAARHTGKTYRIQTIAVGSEPPGGYPVLYLLDGDAFFPMAAVMAQGLEMRAEENRAAPLLIVAVGYPGGRLLDLAARAEDYTPPSENYTDTGDRISKRFGGAEAFRRFLNEELKPEIAARFNTNPQQQALFGHSYGGLYALYTLLNHRADFNHYLIASPSVWWNNGRILNDLPAFLNSRPKAAKPANVRLSAGGYEETPAPHLPATHERHTILKRKSMVTNTRRIGAALAALPAGAAVNAQTEIYPQATHAAAGFLALSDGLKFIYRHCLADPACAHGQMKQHPARPEKIPATSTIRKTP